MLYLDDMSLLLLQKYSEAWHNYADAVWERVGKSKKTKPRADGAFMAWGHSTTNSEVYERNISVRAYNDSLFDLVVDAQDQFIAHFSFMVDNCDDRKSGAVVAIPQVSDDTIKETNGVWRIERAYQKYADANKFLVGNERWNSSLSVKSKQN